MRILFVTPHALSSGEAVTALHAAEQAVRRGATVGFLASPRTAGFLAHCNPETLRELTHDLATNRRLFESMLTDFRPDVVVFADYGVLTEERGGLPLVDDTWEAFLEGVDAALVTFDHLGLEQPTCNLPGGQIARPSRMRVLLPCPLHEPGTVPGRLGIPFRSFEPPALTETQRREMRAEVGVPPGGYLLFHAVASWVLKMAQAQHSPLYARLPAILRDYFGCLPEPVTLLSVNDGNLLPDPPCGNLRIVNMPSLSAARYETLLASSDLVLTENCFSVTVGKAACADVPAIAWHNRLDLRTLLCRLRPETPASILQLVLDEPQSIKPWLTFPAWPLELEPELRVFEGNSLANAFTRLELFGGEDTAEEVRQLMLDETTAHRLREARRSYAENVARLPDFAEVLDHALSAPNVARRTMPGETHGSNRTAEYGSLPRDSRVRSPYLELLKRVLTDTVLSPEPQRGQPGFRENFTRHYFENPRALTCVPRRRLDNVEECVRRSVADGVPGDLLEAGVWRGGITIFMRAVLKELGVEDRAVWVADSFQGLPRPDRERFPKEALAYDSPAMRNLRHLAAPLADVQEAFRRFDLLDDRVRFIPGWFHDTLPSAPIERLAVLRLDADFYDSTREVLISLYDRVAPGGFVIIDDYGEDDWTDCRRAVDEFRCALGIRDPLEPVDEYCWMWRKQGG